jgi:predicted ABC-type ATPase
MKELIILGGANGSGKSTLAINLIHLTQFVFLNADELEKNLTESNEIRRQIQAGKLFFEKLETLLESNSNFIIESTLSGNYLVKVIKRAQQEGYKISLLYLFLKNTDLCIERIKIRVQKGGHHVPNDVVQRRYYKSLILFWEKYKNLTDDWILYYNTNAQIEPIAIGTFEQFIVLNEALFQLFQQQLSWKSEN